MELLTVNVVRLIELQLFNVVVLLPRIGGLQGVLGKQRRHVLGVHFQSNALLNPQRERHRDRDSKTERERERKTFWKMDIKMRQIVTSVLLLFVTQLQNASSCLS